MHLKRTRISRCEQPKVALQHNVQMMKTRQPDGPICEMRLGKDEIKAVQMKCAKFRKGLMVNNALNGPLAHNQLSQSKKVWKRVNHGIVPALQSLEIWKVHEILRLELGVRNHQMFNGLHSLKMFLGPYSTQILVHSLVPID